MLELRSIAVHHGGVQALRDVSLRVDEGEIVALVGANGAGKTTTLRAISGLVRPTSGSIHLDGAAIERLAPERIVARGVAHIPEGRGIFGSLTVGENLRMGYVPLRGRTGWDEARERAVTLFPRLQERWDQAAGTLSGGEQQMLAVARALLPAPRLLMVDELSLGLAPMIVRQLFDAIERINADGTAVLLVEQHVNLALAVAARAYVLEKGSIVADGEASELAGSDAMRAAYLGTAVGAAR